MGQKCGNPEKLYLWASCCRWETIGICEQRVAWKQICEVRYSDLVTQGVFFLTESFLPEMVVVCCVCLLCHLWEEGNTTGTEHRHRLPPDELFPFISSTVLGAWLCHQQTCLFWSPPFAGCTYRGASVASWTDWGSQCVTVLLCQPSVECVRRGPSPSWAFVISVCSTC